MKKNRIWTVLFGLYCALMLWLLFHRPGHIEGVPYWDQLSLSINLIPLRTIRKYLRLLSSSRAYLVRTAVVNLFGNVIMFIPLGYLLPKISVKLQKLWKVLLITALSITIVEMVQLFTLVGSLDVDDLILNLIGSAMGYGLYRLFREKQKRKPAL